MHPTKEIIASWPKPNYVNPETRGSALTVVNVIFIILVVIVAALRFYTRIKITHSFGTDDWVIAASLVRRTYIKFPFVYADSDAGSHICPYCSYSAQS